MSIQSAKRLGYDVTVYTFDPDSLGHEGLDCRIADARDHLGDDVSMRLRRIAPALFSDRFRLEGIANGCGTWFDLDIILLRRFPANEHLFGWEDEKAICNAVLRMPTNSPLFREYLSVCRRGSFQSLPWFSWRKRISRHVRSIAHELIGSKPNPLPLYGPVALTYLVRKHRMEHLAQPRRVLYPAQPSKAGVAKMWDWPADVIGPDTVCLHLWRKLWRQVHGSAEPEWAQRFEAIA